MLCIASLGQGAVSLFPDKIASYQGGLDSLNLYLKQNFELQKGETANGTLYFQILIDTNGHVIETNLLKGLNPSQNQEGLRVANAMKNWIPAEKNHVKVHSYYQLGIHIDNSVGLVYSKNTAPLNPRVSFSKNQAQKINDSISYKPEILAEFPGGMPNFYAYFNDYFNEPEIKAEGKTFVKFKITSSGTIEDVAILFSLGEEYDKALLELFRYMPKWIPAKKNGKAVDSYYSIPFLFKNQ